ncbi:acyl-CoA dehydrogenase family member 10, partial [Chanos chanos]|uniref:Acyl-CoA dehydrogenase family member 10 n=1 Tax=Chanos chanos TaxID=29144 RepID=A0A6J2UTE0_CHACN
MAWAVSRVAHLPQVAVRFGFMVWRPLSHRHMSVASTTGFKAVVFDMYGVLIPSPVPKATEWEDKNRVPRGTIGKAIRTGGDSNSWRRFMRGEIDSEEFVKAFSLDCSKIVGSQVHVGSFLSALTDSSMMEPVPVMMEAVQCVRAEGLKTAILSNNFLLPGGRSFLPVDRSLFDVVVESCKEGVCKPDVRIYRLCADRLGVCPHQAVFLDDLHFNVEAAALVGMRGITVRDPLSAVRELEQVLQFSLSGFVPGTCSVRPGYDLPVKELNQYLTHTVGLSDPDTVTLQQFNSGDLGATYLLRTRGRRLVLKKGPQPEPLGREHRLLKALKQAEVPVPEVIAHSDDPSVLGGEFYLREYCPGRVFSDPTLPGLGPEQRRIVCEVMIQTLAQIHTVDLRTSGLQDCRGESVEQCVVRWTEQYRRNETQPISAMDRLIDWLPLHLPKQHTHTLLHGDYRLCNLVYGSEMPEVKAVLGWGKASVGDPLMDVASACLSLYTSTNTQTHTGTGVKQLSSLGIPSPEELFELYGRCRLLEDVADWRFYMALCCFCQASASQTLHRHSFTGTDQSTDT